MKALVLILSLFLSFLGGGKESHSRQYEEIRPAVETAGQGNADNASAFLPQALLPVQEARVSGQGFGIEPSVRASNSSRRTQISQKFPFRVIKAGKIIDRYHFFVFQRVLHQYPSGIHSTSRYIHTLCSLLI